MKDISMISAVLTGVIIFIISQYLLELILKPAAELRRTIGRIANILCVYDDTFILPPSTDEQHRKEASQKIEQLAGNLLEGYLTIPFYRYISRLFFLPSESAVLDAADKLRTILDISQSNAKWILERNTLLIIEVLALTRAPIPKRLGNKDKEKLRAEIKAKGGPLV